MADPTRLDFADWFSVVATAIVSGIGGAMAWFASSKRDLYKKFAALEDNMKGFDAMHADHNTSLAVLQTCQRNTEERLEAIVETTHDTNQSLKELSQTVTQVLIAIQSQKK